MFVCFQTFLLGPKRAASMTDVARGCSAWRRRNRRLRAFWSTNNRLCEWRWLPPLITVTTHRAREHAAPATSVSLYPPAPVTEYVAPALADACAAPGPVIEHVTPAPVIGHVSSTPDDTFAASAIEHVTPALARHFTALSAVIKCVDPALADACATPAPVIEFVTPSPVLEYIAAAPSVTFATRQFT